MEQYLVWFDLELDDYFAISTNNSTDALLKELKKNGTKTFNIFANSSIEAINKKFPKENRYYLHEFNINVSDKKILEFKPTILH